MQYLVVPHKEDTFHNYLDKCLAFVVRRNLHTNKRVYTLSSKYVFY